MPSKNLCKSDCFSPSRRQERRSRDGGNSEQRDSSEEAIKPARPASRSGGRDRQRRRSIPLRDIRPESRRDILNRGAPEPRSQDNLGSGTLPGASGNGAQIERQPRLRSQQSIDDEILPDPLPIGPDIRINRDNPAVFGGLMEPGQFRRGPQYSSSGSPDTISEGTVNRAIDQAQFYPDLTDTISDLDLNRTAEEVRGGTAGDDGLDQLSSDQAIQSVGAQFPAATGHSTSRGGDQWEYPESLQLPSPSVVPSARSSLGFTNQAVMSIQREDEQPRGPYRVTNRAASFDDVSIQDSRRGFTVAAREGRRSEQSTSAHSGRVSSRSTGPTVQSSPQSILHSTASSRPRGESNTWQHGGSTVLGEGLLGDERRQLPQENQNMFQEMPNDAPRRRRFTPPGLPSFNLQALSPTRLVERLRSRRQQQRSPNTQQEPPPQMGLFVTTDSHDVGDTMQAIPEESSLGRENSAEELPEDSSTLWYTTSGSTHPRTGEP